MGGVGVQIQQRSGGQEVVDDRSVSLTTSLSTVWRSQMRGVGELKVNRAVFIFSSVYRKKTELFVRL